MRRAYVVTRTGREGGAVYHASTAGKARYEALLDWWDAYPDLTFADLRVRRAPVYDLAPRNNGLSEDVVTEHMQAVREVGAWNASHPIGTPVCVRRDGRGQTFTKTRSPASLLCGTAVVWCDGIASCYALSHVTLTVESE